jgi:hypothetical protein
MNSPFETAAARTREPVRQSPADSAGNHRFSAVGRRALSAGWRLERDTARRDCAAPGYVRTYTAACRFSCQPESFAAAGAVDPPAGRAERSSQTKTAALVHHRFHRKNPAQEGTRTPTALRPLVPETSASTNSATWARPTRLVATPTRASNRSAAPDRKPLPARCQPALRHPVYARCTRKIPSAIAARPPMSRVPTGSPSSTYAMNRPKIGVRK